MLAGTVGGLIPGALAAVLVALLAGGAFERPTAVWVALFLVWCGAIAIAARAPSAAKAWRRVLAVAAGLSFLMPVAALAYARSVVPGQGVEGAAPVFAAIANGVVGTVVGIGGVVLGAALLFSCVVIGGSRPTTHERRPASSTSVRPSQGKPA